MSDLRDVLSGQILVTDQIPTEGECAFDPLVADLDDRGGQVPAEFLPRRYVRVPMPGAVPNMIEVDMVARYASANALHGRAVIFVSAHPVPRSMCAARCVQVTIGGTIQSAMLLVNKADPRAFDDDKVVDVMLAIGGGVQ